MIIKVLDADFSSVSIGKAYNQCWVTGEGTANPNLFIARDGDTEYSKCEIVELNNPSPCDYVRKITQTSQEQQGRLVTAPTVEIYQETPEPIYPDTLGMTVWLREPDGFADLTSAFYMFQFGLQANLNVPQGGLIHYQKSNLVAGTEITATLDGTLFNYTYKIKKLKTAKDINNRNWYAIGVIAKFNSFKAAYDALDNTRKQLRVVLGCGTGWTSGTAINYIGNLQIVTKLLDDSYLNPDVLYQ